MFHSSLSVNFATRLFSLLLAVVLALGSTGCSEDPGEDPDDPSQPSNQANHNNGDDTDVGIDGGTNGGGSAEDADRPDEDSGQDWDFDDEDFDVHAVIPDRGSVDGNTRVEIAGEALNDSIELWFGNKPAEPELSDGRLVAHTPPADQPGPVPVRAVSPEGEEVTLSNGFTYVDDARIDDVVPSIVPTDGGVQIDVIGTGFHEDTGVSFSGVPARHIQVVNDTLLRVEIPPMPRGDADLRVTTPHSGDIAESAVHFFEPIDVDTITPGVGDIDGGDQVVIEAAGLDDDTSVYFDNTAADVLSYDDTESALTVSTPPGSPGAADVEIVADYDNLLVVDGFFYDNATESIRSIQPDTAELDGGEHIVSGRGLDAADAEIIIGNDAATIVDAEPTHAVVDIPASTSPGTVDVVFERNGSEVDRLEDGLEYLPEFTVDTIDPTVGDADGGETVTVTGVGLEQTERVTFGGVQGDFTVDGDDLTVTTPPGEPGVVDLVVDDGDRPRVIEEGFTYETAPEIWSMQPSRGAVAGDTYVTLQGRGLLGATEVEVEGESAEQLENLDPYNVAFRTPPASSTGDHTVTLHTDVDSANAPYPFVYFDPATSFGGAWGPPVDGDLNVTVLNFDGTPVGGAFVMVGTDPDTPYQGFANAGGQITFSSPDVIGPLTVTATAAEMSTFTVREIDAQNLTLILNPTDPEQGDPDELPPIPMSHFEGTVTVEGKTPDPDGATQINHTKVRTTTNTIGSWQMPPGDQSDIEGGEGDYVTRANIGDMALVALCGWYDEDTDQFTPKLMGVQRNLSTANGDRVDVDLECDIPLDASLPVQLLDAVYAPDGPTLNEITPYLDFGYEGVFEMPNTTTGLSDILTVEGLPTPEGDLQNVTFAADVGSFTNGSMPYTRTTVTDIADVGGLFTTPPLVAVPEMIDPLPGGAIDDQIWLGQKGSNSPDFVYLSLNNAMGLPVWSFVIPGDDVFVPMPEFPSFSELSADERPTPYGHYDLYALAYAPRISGFDYNAFTWYDLQRSQWSTYAAEAWTLDLPQ